MANRVVFTFDEGSIDALKALVSKTPVNFQPIIEKFWIDKADKNPQPLTVVLPDGKIFKNRALIELEARSQTRRAFPSLQEYCAATSTLESAQKLYYEELLREKETQIRVLTKTLDDLQRSTVPAEEAAPQAEETSLLLAFWNAINIKPGAFGFSLDVKTLVGNTHAILEDRYRPITLGLNTPSKK